MSAYHPKADGVDGARSGKVCPGSTIARSMRVTCTSTPRSTPCDGLPSSLSPDLLHCRHIALQCPCDQLARPLFRGHPNRVAQIMLFESTPNLRYQPVWGAFLI